MNNNKEDLKNLRDKTQKQLDTKNYANEDVKESLEQQLDNLNTRINNLDNKEKK